MSAISSLLKMRRPFPLNRVLNYLSSTQQFCGSSTIASSPPASSPSPLCYFSVTRFETSHFSPSPLFLFRPSSSDNVEAHIYLQKLLPKSMLQIFVMDSSCPITSSVLAQSHFSKWGESLISQKIHFSSGTAWFEHSFPLLREAFVKPCLNLLEFMFKNRYVLPCDLFQNLFVTLEGDGKFYVPHVLEKSDYWFSDIQLLLHRFVKAIHIVLHAMDPAFLANLDSYSIYNWASTVPADVVVSCQSLLKLRLDDCPHVFFRNHVFLNPDEQRSYAKAVYSNLRGMPWVYQSSLFFQTSYGVLRHYRNTEAHPENSIFKDAEAVYENFSQVYGVSASAHLFVTELCRLDLGSPLTILGTSSLLRRLHLVELSYADQHDMLAYAVHVLGAQLVAEVTSELNSFFGENSASCYHPVVVGLDEIAMRVDVTSYMFQNHSYLERRQMVLDVLRKKGFGLFYQVRRVACPVW